MRIAIVTDAWSPQINGVVTALTHTRKELEAMGHAVTMVTPQSGPSVPMPTYREIRLALRPARAVHNALTDFAPDAIHIVTEGPLGLAARAYCRRRGLPFTTSFHTRFPEYVQMRLPFVPLEWGYAFLRWFHAPAERTLVSNDTMEQELAAHGIGHLARWSRGVDTALFRPQETPPLAEPGPVLMYVGRVAVEKNLEDFLRLNVPGTKIVVGDGPARATLQNRYPDAVFTGYKTGEELARHLAAADVFVFPSRTDTLGLVMYEALACGVPVAAYPVQGPLNVVSHGITGFLDEDLGQAVRGALTLDPGPCRAAAENRSWRAATRELVANLAPIAPAFAPTPPPSQQQ